MPEFATTAGAAALPWRAAQRTWITGVSPPLFGPLIVVSLIQTSEAFKRGLERLEALLTEK